MSNIEDDIKILTEENSSYKKEQAIQNILSEREQDKARIKALELQNKQLEYYIEELKKYNKTVSDRIIEYKKNSIPKQKVKGIVKQIQEEHDKVQEQFNFIWNKKSKDNYDRYKLQELSAMQQELGFILGKFEELLEEGE